MCYLIDVLTVYLKAIFFQLQFAQSFTSCALGSPPVHLSPLEATEPGCSLMCGNLPLEVRGTTGTQD